MFKYYNGETSALSTCLNFYLLTPKGTHLSHFRADSLLISYLKIASGAPG